LASVAACGSTSWAGEAIDVTVAAAGPGVGRRRRGRGAAAELDGEGESGKPVLRTKEALEKV
jgi:hypothetical protein